jgi:hypothetical protein
MENDVLSRHKPTKIGKTDVVIILKKLGDGNSKGVEIGRKKNTSFASKLVRSSLMQLLSG